MKIYLYLFVAIIMAGCCAEIPSEDKAHCGGEKEPAGFYKWVDLFNGKDLTGWVDVNTRKQNWKAVNGELHCEGTPIGVMRTERMYENFVMHIEWKHMKKKGNSGVFIWSDAVPEGNRLPLGMEVQMLELDWINKKNGKKAPIGYISGELFGAGGMTATPDNPRGNRSMSKELRCKGVGEWNTYTFVAVDGVVKLAINGKFVNGIRDSSRKKGYICLESEGSPIHFRNIKIMELPPGILKPEEVVPEIK